LGLRVGDLRSRVKFKRKRNSFNKSAVFPKIIQVEKILEQISRIIGFAHQNCHSFGYVTLCISRNRCLASNDMVVMYVILERMKKEAAVTCFNMLPVNPQRTTEKKKQRKSSFGITGAPDKV
jgi:hypothetical protein